MPRTSSIGGGLAGQELLEILALRVNFVTVPQVARTWFEHTEHSRTEARALLTSLVKENVLAPRLLLNAYAEQPVEKPVFVWELGDPTPDYRALSERLRARWHGLSWLETQAFAVTQRGAEMVAGGLTPALHAEDENHDLHVTAMFLTIRHEHPEWASHWISDRHYHQERGRPPEFREKTPDALIRINGFRRVIDFGGSYHVRKVASIHEFWSAAKIPYELW